MRPRQFEYYAPSSMPEALSLLSKSEDPKILAGGQSLLTLMKLRLTTPASLIDINRIAELNYIREENGAIAIGSLTRHDQLATSPIMRQKCRVLAEAAGVIADQQVRNRGSIGGSIAHADPSADLPTACTALNANITVKSQNASRTIASKDFFLDVFTTALRTDEIVVEVRIPTPPRGSGGAYAKLTKGHNDFALVAVAAQLLLTSDGTCQDINVVLGGVASKPTHAVETEGKLLHQRINDQLIHDAASNASSDLTPSSDPRATPQLKLRMIRMLTERTLRTAFNRARGVAGQ